jgi:3-hydroxyisobutyrate dehydrogenase-like beta-hydroxyacid dehydrogenase
MHKHLTIRTAGPYTAYSNRMRSGDYHTRAEPLFAIDLALKDAGHAQALAAKSDAPLAGLDVVQYHLQQVKEIKGEKGDVAGLYGVVRTQAGLDYENEVPK